MDCKYFDDCSAPLCPRDEGVADRTWFPDEDICRLKDVPEWVKRQRKVSRKAAEGGYFTLAMLRHDCRIAQGIKGVDPDGTDRERAADEAAWFVKHPAITAEEREKLKARGEKNKGVLALHRASKTTREAGVNILPNKKGIWIPLSPERA
jgi:hypothetical protein